MTAAAVYALTLTSPTALGAVPEEAPEKAHHLKDGKGFTNPWESWREFQVPQILRKMIWWVAFPFWNWSMEYQNTLLTHPQGQNHRGLENARHYSSNSDCNQTDLPPF
jgi:hypothetical protein